MSIQLSTSGSISDVRLLRSSAGRISSLFTWRAMVPLQRARRSQRRSWNSIVREPTSSKTWHRSGSKRSVIVCLMFFFWNRGFVKKMTGSRLLHHFSCVCGGRTMRKVSNMKQFGTFNSRPRSLWGAPSLVGIENFCRKDVSKNQNISKCNCLNLSILGQI